MLPYSDSEIIGANIRGIEGKLWVRLGTTTQFPGQWVLKCKTGL